MKNGTQIPRTEWAARYATEALRCGSSKSLKEVVAVGLSRWRTARLQRPEDVAFRESQYRDKSVRD
jgi:hypothetical protein